MLMSYLTVVDPEIARIIKEEEKRQANTLMMIASENSVSMAVREAVSSVFMNKYAEGYSGRRYYQGNAVADKLEALVSERARKLFGVEYVNVQPHSGSPANFAVYTALLKPGDTIMGLSLASGGHLTHGAFKNASSIYFRSVSYDVTPDGLIDYDALLRLARKVKPHIIVAGTTAYARFLDWKKFASIAKEAGSYLLADMSHIAGLVATGNYPSPIPYAHVVTTTTHKTLRGPRGAMIMATRAGIRKDPDLVKKINSAIIPGIQGGPHLHSIAGIGVALKEASRPAFKTYAKQIVKNAKILAGEFNKLGMTLVTGGTDSHLILADMRPYGILGNTAAEACEHVGIILNRNGVPHDTNPPFYPSGIRLGTPGVTSRGMKEQQMKRIAHLIVATITSVAKTKKQLGIAPEDERKPDVRKRIISQTKELKPIMREVKQLATAFPLKKRY